MGILDLFAKKENASQEMKSLNKDLHTHIGKLESLSVKLNEQTSTVQELSVKSLPEQLTSFIHALETHQQKIKDAQMAISTLAVMDVGDKDLKSQISMVERNIGAINAVLEMELKDANSHLKLLNKYCNDFNKPIANLHGLLENIAKLHGNLDSLSQRSAKLAEEITIENPEAE